MVSRAEVESMNKRLMPIFLVTVVVAGLIVVGLMRKRTGEGSDAKPTTVAVEAAPVRDTLIREVLTYTGTLEGDNEVTVVSQAAGTIKSLPLRVGAACKAGSVLAVIENTTQQAVLAQATAQVMAARTNTEKAEKDYERITSLHASGAAPLTDLDAMRLGLDAARAQFKSAEAQLALAKKQYDDTFVRSPIAGTVALKMSDVGKTVAPGAPIAEVVDDSRFRLKVAVPEDAVVKLASGQVVAIFVDALPADTFAGRIDVVARVPSGQSRAYEVEVVIDGRQHASLRSGMFARCMITIRNVEHALTIPESALLTSSDGSAYVYTINGTKPIRTPVRTGIRYCGLCEIVSGLDPACRVVTVGKERLSVDVAEVLVVGAP
jgi:membrane fusion protein (multidrug efflux system)